MNENLETDQWLVMNSHIKDGKTIFRSRNDQGEQGVDFLADIPPFIGNEDVAQLMASAPLMLEALRSVKCLAKNGGKSFMPDIIQICNTAISKALYDK